MKIPTSTARIRMEGSLLKKSAMADGIRQLTTIQRMGSTFGGQGVVTLVTSMAPVRMKMRFGRLAQLVRASRLAGKVHSSNQSKVSEPEIKVQARLGG